MLTKKDLAKEFDLVVKQEIKNYQDSLNGVLQSIRELQDWAAVNQSSIGQCKSALYSFQTEVKSVLDEMKKSHSDLQSEVIRESHDQEAIDNQMMNLLEEGDASIKQFNMISTVTQKLVLGLSERIGDQLLETAEIKRSVQDASDALEAKFKKGLCAMKEEILSTPTKEQLLRKDLEERLKINSVDVEGLLKELRILNHSVLVNEKKIENIYTLIERMQKRGTNEPS